MNIALENLDKITDILKILQILQLNLVNETSKQKRWLSTKELSQYIPYTVETINKKISLYLSLYSSIEINFTIYCVFSLASIIASKLSS
jgi:hypothetical protein